MAGTHLDAENPATLSICIGSITTAAVFETDVSQPLGLKVFSVTVNEPYLVYWCIPSNDVEVVPSPKSQMAEMPVPAEVFLKFAVKGKEQLAESITLKEAWGAKLTVTVFEVESLQPEKNVFTTLTVYMPFWAYILVGLIPVADVLSPKVQTDEVGVGDAELTNCTCLLEQIVSLIEMADLTNATGRLLVVLSLQPAGEVTLKEIT